MRWQGRSSPQAEGDKVVPPGSRLPSWEEARRPSEKQLVSPIGTGTSTSTARRSHPHGEAGELGALPAGARVLTTEGHTRSLPGRGSLVRPTLFCKTSGQPEPHPQNRRNTRLMGKPVSPGGHSQRPACPTSSLRQERSPLEGRQSGTLLATLSVLPTPDCAQQPSHQGKDTGHPVPVWWADGLVCTSHGPVPAG